MSAIPKKHVDEVCKPGQQDGTTCAFLTFGAGGMMCAKATPAVRLAIEGRLAEGTMKAKGDNCPGWLT